MERVLFLMEEGGQMRVIAVDFDGTLNNGKYPYIGEPNTDLIEYLKVSRTNRDKVILWTCREGELLQQAVDWCKGIGLEFDAVNENLPFMIERYGSDPRKIGADLYIDDRNALVTDFKLSRRGRHRI